MIGDEAEIFIWISPLRGILGGSEEGLPTGLQDICVEKVFGQPATDGPLAGSNFKG